MKDITPKSIPATSTFVTGDVLAVLKKLSKKDSKYDLIVTSPPYNIRKIYERSAKLSFEQYLSWLDDVIGALINVLPDHGSICWQVGTFIKNGEVFPLDIHTYDSFKAPLAASSSDTSLKREKSKRPQSSATG